VEWKHPKLASTLEKMGVIQSLDERLLSEECKANVDLWNMLQ